MTPSELNIYANAWADTQRQQAYLDALTIRLMVGSILSGKRPPSYNACFGGNTAKIQQDNTPMTDRQMYDVVQTLNRMFGGDDFTVTGGDIDGSST